MEKIRDLRGNNMMKYNKQITLYLDKELVNDLKAVGEHRGLKLSVLIRNILIDYMRDENGF